ncbi:hypothetical protein [Streptomyces sp. NPDC056387]|uniref:hypothetical protein n=1 Tax=Streptomyces sp. NPDC056387 TaxID=3345803 RepID=UPI0035DBA709
MTEDDSARAAGIGRDTPCRRHPGLTSLARALLDEHERVLQERLLRGAPPHGPGRGLTPSPPGRRASLQSA